MPFLEETAFPFLLEAQNADGGWGFRPAQESRVEPTCWALLALESARGSQASVPSERGSAWLTAAQLPDGSWPSATGLREGGWMTSLACLALRDRNAESAERGARWLCAEWPAEKSLLWRMRARFFSGRSALRQDPSLCGWNWTRGTSSWVEPTALALLALRKLCTRLSLPQANERIELGEALLLDRMCPGGGWNCGNPVVYGNAGRPLAGPTAWALLSLLKFGQQQEIAASLAWLEKSLPGLRGPGSIALAIFCLRTHNRIVSDAEFKLAELFRRGKFLHQVPVTSWAVFALAPEIYWRPQAPFQKN